MRLISALDWTAFFEEISLVERELRRDPAGVYGRMDFATRDHYRHVVESLARRSRLPEVEVAQRVVVEAFQAPKDSARGHIGYYLIDDGRAELRSQSRHESNAAGPNAAGDSLDIRDGLFFGSLGTLWLGVFAAVEAYRERGAVPRSAILILLGRCRPGFRRARWPSRSSII